jgi:hypothetical protein
MIPVLEDIIRGLLNGTMTPEQAKFYLEQHEKLQAEVDAVAEVPFLRATCLVDLIKKCDEQDKRWGAREYSSFDRALSANADVGPIDLACYHEIPNPRRARLTTNSRGENLAWIDILVEEVAKTTEHHDNTLSLRAQLIDVAGVAIQWASQLTPEPKLDFETKNNGDGTVSVSVHMEADHEGPNRGE